MLISRVIKAAATDSPLASFQISIQDQLCGGGIALTGELKSILPQDLLLLLTFTVHHCKYGHLSPTALLCTENNPKHIRQRPTE